MSTNDGWREKARECVHAPCGASARYVAEQCADRRRLLRKALDDLAALESERDHLRGEAKEATEIADELAAKVKRQDARIEALEASHARQMKGAKKASDYVREDRDHWKARAEAAEAKLADAIAIAKEKVASKVIGAHYRALKAIIETIEGGTP